MQPTIIRFEDGFCQTKSEYRRRAFRLTKKLQGREWFEYRDSLSRRKIPDKIVQAWIASPDPSERTGGEG